MTGDRAVQSDVVVISLEDLRVGLHLRESGLNRAHVLSLAELEGDWPPIIIARSDQMVIDGHHRVAAAKHLGLTEVRARLFDGPPEEAYIEFIRGNVSHGLPLSLRERKAAVGHILAAHPDWSDRRVARLCALSPTTVGRLRPTGDCPDAQSGQADTRVGRDGSIRSIDPEGTRARVVEALAARPQSSLRAVAHAVGVSPETVRNVRKSLKQPNATDPPLPEIASLADLVGRGRPAMPTEPWQDDRALSSLDCVGFMAWLKDTSVDDADCWRYLGEVPLSRIYIVADEARRRANSWSTFAAALEDRVNTRVVRA